jgi:hypothetical protein
MDAAGWACGGGSISGIFALIGMLATGSPGWLFAATSVASGALAIGAYSLLKASASMQSATADRVTKLRQEMVVIEAECDQERSL